MRLGLEAGGDTLDLAVEHGVKGVPIGADALVNDGVDATLAPLRQRGLAVCQIGAFGYNPLSTDRERQAQQAAMLAKAIPLAGETGCAYITICGGNYHPSGFGAGDARNFDDGALDAIAEALAPMVRLAEQHGVKLTIEPISRRPSTRRSVFWPCTSCIGSDALRVNVDVTSLYDYEDLWDPTETVSARLHIAGRPLRPGPHQRGRAGRGLSHPRRPGPAGHRSDRLGAGAPSDGPAHAG